jgi:hypothetical protein
MSRPGEYPFRLSPSSDKRAALVIYCTVLAAFDCGGKQIGTFENINVGTAALLELAITTDKETND